MVASKQVESSREAERKLKRERAEAANVAARELLLKHIQAQDARLRQSMLEKKAAAQKRLADAFDPTPARRKMYDDHALAIAAQVPGPGTYTPRLRQKDSSGKTFGPPHILGADGTMSVASFDRDAGSVDAYRVKIAAEQPGPASYSPSVPRGGLGTTFGMPPKLRGVKEVPSAHDMTKMVEHLRDLPAPDAYTPRDPIMKNKGFRMVPSNAKSSLDHAMQAAAKVPGPGHYDLSLSLSSGRSASLGGGGLVKSELDVVMNRAKELPGPGAYAHHTTMRSKGSPRFSKAGGLSLIEAIQAEARSKPGPGTYYPTTTFEEDLAERRYMRAAIRGEHTAGSSLSLSARGDFAGGR